MQVESKPDGEFWMSFKEFCRQFQEVTICTLGPDFDGDGKVDQAGEKYHHLSPEISSPFTCRQQQL